MTLRLTFYERNTGKPVSWMETGSDGVIHTMTPPGTEYGMEKSLAMRHAGEKADDFLRRMARHYGWTSVLEDSDNPRPPRDPRPLPTGRFVAETPESDHDMDAVRSEEQPGDAAADPLSWADQQPAEPRT